VHWESAFETFFKDEGASLANASALHRLARRALAERAYWGVASKPIARRLGTEREIAIVCPDSVPPHDAYSPRQLFIPPEGHIAACCKRPFCLGIATAGVLNIRLIGSSNALS